MSAAAVVVAVFAGGLVAPSAAHAGVPVQVDRPAAAVASEGSQVLLTNWISWDGNKITSAAKCNWRADYLRRTYGIPSAAIGCWPFEEGLPPCTQRYWLVMIDVDNALPAPVARVVDPTSSIASAACG